MLCLINECIHSLDWNTGLSYFPFLEKFVLICRKKHTYFTTSKYLATMDDCNNYKSCLLQCFQQMYIHLKIDNIRN